MTILALWGLATAAAAPALSQSLPGCESQTLSDPERTIYVCGDGLVIEAAAGATLGFVGDSPAQGVRVDNGAVMVDAPKSEAGFAIQTPHAIAAVRGTVYAVEVAREETAVFVLEGSVGVSETAGGEGVTLNAGEGVDVPAQGPAMGTALEVKTWGPDRVSALMAHFGR
ncbi:MAG: FecR family protein [Pseudomonadota bacterium]